MRTDRLFERRCVVFIGAGPEVMRLEGLRFVFKAVKTLKREPNTLELSITNLNPSSRAQLRAKGVRVVVQAGYPTSLGTIFSGHVRTIDHTHPDPDWVTKVQCGDGESAAGVTGTTESFAAGTPLSNKLAALTKALGVDPGNLNKQLAGVDTKALSGHASHGNAARELDRIVRRLGLEWSIQDGRLQLLKPETTTDEEAVLLSAQTGMVGSPEHKTPARKGKPTAVKVKSLLQPGFRPGRKVQLQASSNQGLFAISKTTHVGDTHGEEWFSELELFPVGTGVPVDIEDPVVEQEGEV